MTTTAVEDFFTVDPTTTLKADLTNMVSVYAAAHGRNHQRDIGPSELGNPCDRRLAYRLLHVQKCNPSFDPLPSVIGIASHRWMEEAAQHTNRLLGRERFLTETRVQVAPGLAGTADLFDRDTSTVVDHKFPGVNRFAAYVKDPGTVYRVQCHLYGMGFTNMGVEVKQVGIMFFPRGGTLAGAHLHVEPYDEQLAQEAISRRDNVVRLIHDLGVEGDPSRFEWLARHGHDCVFCPWWSPNPSGPLQCGGLD